jgi:hypothetical protein
MQTTPRKELLFSGGAGALTYEMGYVQAILEIVGKPKLREYIIGGVSSGAACAGFLYCAIHSEYDLRYWFAKSGRRFYEPPNKKFLGLITTGDLVYELGKEYYEFCKEKGIPDFKGRFHCGISVIQNFTLEKEILDDFKDADDFGAAIKATTFLPGIGGFGIYTRFRGKKVMDGGLTCGIPYRYADSDKVFVNVLPDRWPFVRERPENTYFLNISEMSQLNFPMDYWLWKETWADDMFLKGYLTGLKTQDEIKKAFKIN